MEDLEYDVDMENMKYVDKYSEDKGCVDKANEPKIVFRGNLTGKCYKFIRHKSAGLLFIIFFCTHMVFCAIVVWLPLPLNFIITSIIVTSVLWILFPLLALTIPENKQPFLSDFEFYEKDIIMAQIKGDSICRFYSDIKKIIDIGDGYYFVFKLHSRSPLHLCQKDLIVKGTIEEFEEMFRDYIVKKKN